MSKQSFLCPLDGWECTYLGEWENNGQTHELWQCTHPRCDHIHSPVKIRNGKKEVTA